MAAMRMAPINMRGSFMSYSLMDEVDEGGTTRPYSQCGGTKPIIGALQG
jgi:hypothetical protein